MAQHPGFGELRLLLVEDNPSDQELVRTFLRRGETEGASVHLAETLGAALKALETHREDGFDCVLLDLNLTDSSGLETLDAVVAASPRVPVVVLTRVARGGSIVEPVRRGADEYLPKDEITPLLLERAIGYAIERKRAEEAVRRGHDRFRAIFESGPYGIVVVRNGTIQQVNARLAELFGYGPGELIGESVEVLVPEASRAVHRELRSEYVKEPHMRPMGEELDLSGRRKDGSLFPVDIMLSHYPENDDIQVIAVVHDITERIERDRALRAANAELERLANTDPLTGLANRRHFMDRLALEAERGDRYDRILSLLQLDLDHFKRVNDAYGHGTGDAVLQSTARILKAISRQVDLPARIGGEEMALLLPETDQGGARSIAERLRTRIEKAGHRGPSGESFRVTASIGVASRAPGGGGPGDLMERADKALYEAKRAGRNRVVLATG